jgi:hypothetical protein
VNLQVPHNFPSLRNGNRRPVIVIGAGMSVPDVPAVEELFEQKHESVEQALFGSRIKGFDDHGGDRPFYVWAQHIVEALVARKDRCPRLTLAKALGLLDDKRWSPEIELSLNRSAPRHRVIARFARGGRWSALWSLNWDCWLESGLRSVGLGNADGSDSLPWPTSYISCVTLQDVLPAASDKVVSLYKPHGCVSALTKAQEAMSEGDDQRALALSDGFVVTSNDLGNIKPNPANPARQVLYNKLRDQLIDCPLVVAGWRADERCLIELFRHSVKPVKKRGGLAQDELTVVDLNFQPGHEHLAECYDLSEADCFVRVLEDGFNRDSLFLWVQALYALDHLYKHADESVKPRLKAILDNLMQPVPNHFVLDWADSFLSTWVRLCWRSELVTCYLNGHPVPSHAISMESRDEHIPWNVEHGPRPDLAGAAALLSAIAEAGNIWEFSTFPGALWRDDDCSLTVPLPAWDGCQRMNNLRGLKPLADCLGRDMARVSGLCILPVTIVPGQIVSEETIMLLKHCLARELPHTHFAQVENIKVVNATNLGRRHRHD